MQEYLVDLNASAAYLRAGYCSSNANVCGPKLLAKAGIRAEIEKAQAARSKRTDITADFVLGELAKIAGFDPRRLFNNDGSVKLVGEWDDGTAASVASFDTAEIFDGQGDQKHCVGLSKKVNTRDKVRALELLGKHLGLFPNKVEGSMKVSLEDLVASARGND